MFDFPNAPTAGQQVTGSGNQVYTFDGQKWAASGAGLNQATADARYVNASGDTMAGDLLLAADPTASMQAATRHYVDNAINLAGNYLGTWSVAANSPSISAGGSIANANYIAVTVNPAVAETAPAGIPGIAGQSINNGDRVMWASGLSIWQILRGAGLNTSIGDGRYVQLAGATMSGLLVLSGDPGAALGAATKQYVDTKAAAGVVSFNSRTGAVTLNNTDVTTVLPPSSTTPAMDGAAAIGVGTTWARADHIHPTDTSRYAATNPSGYQTAAQVAAVVPGVNYADNAGFAINQRSYVSGTALASGAFGHDRWKGGAGGCTYTFTQSGSPATTVTITAGTLQQVVEGAAILGGVYTLSWTGTAQGRVGAGSYAASPVTTASLTAAANATIEFNTGTLGRVKFEAGSTATPWVADPPQPAFAKCQRFYIGNVQVNLSGTSTTGVTESFPVTLPVTMRAVPALNYAGTGGAGWASVGVTNISTFAFSATVAPNATAYIVTYTWNASADL